MPNHPFDPTALPGSQPDSHPPDPIWLAIANSTLAPDAALPHLLHAAQCRTCAELLAAATASYAAPAPESPEEAAFLAQLTTSTPAAQLTLAQKLGAPQPALSLPKGLASETWAPTPTKPEAEPEELQPTFTLRPEKSRPRRRFALWTTLTAAAITLCAASVLLVRALRPPSDAQLLALAYNKNRITELRLPNTAAVPLASPTRGSNSPQFESIELLNAKTRAQQQFDRNPNDPRVRQFRGEVFIVEDAPEDALKEFEMAQALGANTPSINFDLGTAYFDLAEADPIANILDYARAADSFAQYLQQVHDSDPVALFDLGLCWERSNVTYNAIKNFEAALKLERDPAWRAEIQRHLAKLKAQAALDLSTEQLEATLTPQHFLTLTTESPGQYELYLDAATRKWLPARQPSPQITKNAQSVILSAASRKASPREAESKDPDAPHPATTARPFRPTNPPLAPTTDPNLEPALQKLAQWGLTHHDRWLTDILRQPQTPLNHLATQTLAQAVTASASGKADDALAYSALAITQFHLAHNHPGELRAQAEHIYALQRSTDARKCLDEGEQFRTTENLESYVLIKGTAGLELSACNALLGRVSKAISIAEESENIILRNGLENAQLRTVAFLAELNFRMENYQTAWTLGTNGLKQSQTTTSVPMRKYQFLDAMEHGAEQLSLNYCQAGLAEAAATAARATSNKGVIAYSLEILAHDELKIGNTVEALNATGAAGDQLGPTSHDEASQIYRAQIEADHAVILYRQGKPQEAIPLMESQERIFDRNQSLFARQRFYAELGDLLTREHLSRRAIQKAGLAVAEAEWRLHSLKTQEQRHAWLQEAEPSYAALTLAYVQQGDPTKALNTWLRFEVAPFADLDPAIVSPHPNTPENQNGLDSKTNPQDDSITVLFANLNGTVVAWSYLGSQPGKLHMKVLPESATLLDAEASAFHRICSDPNSSLRDIHLLGTMLYTQLFSTLDSALAQSHLIRILTSKGLQQIPFAALSQGEQFIGAKHPILVLTPQSLSDGAAHPEHIFAADDPVLILRQTQVGYSPQIPTEYDESSEISDYFHESKLEPVSITFKHSSMELRTKKQISHQLTTASIIHYEGHGLQAQGDLRANTNGVYTSMRSGILSHCQLAVLAACQSGTEREAPQKDDPSFARRIAQAGAKQVLASHWDVDSRATRKLISTFYQQLAHRKKPSDSLQTAAQTLQGIEEFKHPYFWASFTLSQYN